MSSLLTKSCHSYNISAAAVPAICVVDPQVADYSAWRELAERDEIQLCCFTSASEALRHARSHHVDLWVVNTELPGISGCELCGMLRSQRSEVPVYVVADEYSAHTELAAWQARATLFDCKPLLLGRLATWLTHWRSCHPRPTIRRSPLAPASTAF